MGSEVRVHTAVPLPHFAPHHLPHQHSQHMTSLEVGDGHAFRVNSRNGTFFASTMHFRGITCAIDRSQKPGYSILQ